MNEEAFLLSLVEGSDSNQFGLLAPQPADALLDLIRAYREDPRPFKIDLGVGVFRDDLGATPVMRAVKDAEFQLLREQPTKSYLGPEGDPEYVELLADLVFGDNIACDERLTGVQTPGGTGALCLGSELIKASNPNASVWIGAPTWPNHEPIFRRTGLRTVQTRYYKRSNSSLTISGLLEDLSEARRGDVVLLHGCCHNPTGATPTNEQWNRISQFCLEKGLIPFIDLAYQGLGDGLEQDAASARKLLKAFPEALVAYSCDKNFGLYRERVGALFIWAANPLSAQLARGNVLSLAREMWSMPPDHGAAIVRLILSSEVLRPIWEGELNTMRSRINLLREQLAAAHPALQPIRRQRGMFALLPIEPSATVDLREQHAIYMAGNGRINIAGLRSDTIAPFVAGLAPHL